MMTSRSCASTSASSNGGGLHDQKRKTSAGAEELNGLPLTESADLPVRPFGAEPAEPASAAGAPPDAPGAAPARALRAFLAIVLLGTAAPVLAGHCREGAKNPPKQCRVKRDQPAAAAPAKKAAPRTTVVMKSAGGGFTHWMPIASDLMP
jgi:hypothetical protein